MDETLFITCVYCGSTNWEATRGAWAELTGRTRQATDIDSIMAVYRAADALGHINGESYRGFCAVKCYNNWIDEHKELVVVEMAKL